jgi:hypothetical protein
MMQQGSTKTTNHLAPGISQIKLLSTISIDVIDIVSVAKAPFIASFLVAPDLTKLRDVNKYPKRNARTIDKIVWIKLDDLEAITIPKTSPIEHPNKQCNVWRIACLVIVSILLF